MVAPKHKQQTLWVRAVGLVRHIDTETGAVLQNMRFVGRDADLNELPSGEEIAYHSFYIKQLMDRALEPMDYNTAQLAGINFTKE